MTNTETKTGSEFPAFLNFVWPILLSMLLVFGIFYQTSVSMIEIWSTSETYAHGFIILPLSLWLLWQDRHEIYSAPPKIDVRAYVFLLGAVVLWMLAEFVGVQIAAQFAVVLVVITAVWLLLGWQVGKKIFFPMVFLLFMVPAGDFLVPQMMEFTASFTVAMLRLSGIPVFREGLFFTIPSGNWSVVEACSGVRYIIASVTLGVLFAFLNYRSLVKQITFIIVSFLVPILANGLRAYMIVMIGHLSGMELATGVDHLVYGWVFFGIVMLILFSIGAIWRDDMSAQDGAKSFAGYTPQGLRSMGKAFVVIAVTVFLPFLYVNASLPASLQQIEHFKINNPAKGWDSCEFGNDWLWRPRFVETSAQLAERYCTSTGNESIGQFVGYYTYQTQGAEAVNRRNSLAPYYYEDNIREKVQLRDPKPVIINSEKVIVDAAVVSRQGHKYRAWLWYRIGRMETSDQVKAKIYEAYSKLVENRGDAMILVMATPIQSTAEIEAADARLQQYVNEVIPGLYNYVDELQ
ncbi:MAG: exosortase A [Chromatiales bacterium]|jgi:exosortase A